MRTNILTLAAIALLALAGCNRESSQSQESPPPSADAIQDIAPASQPAPPEDAQHPDADADDEQEVPAPR